ncbi:MAG: polysaccharide deacetylase family protein [Marinoscillum sp.]
MKSKLIILAILLTVMSCDNAGSKQIAEANDNPKEVVCFVYHRFGDGRYPSTNISLPDFKAHLDYLKKEGFNVVTFSQAIDYLRSSDPVQKTAVISVDDGYDSFYENGLPLLEARDYPATLFINTESVGGADYMCWEDLKDARSRGIEIGNHTHSHAYFLNQPEQKRYDNFKSELKLTQKLIKEKLDYLPTTFAYPYGELDTKMREIVESLGFKGAAAQNSGVISSSTDLLRCPRFPMSESYAAIDKFKSKADMHALSVIEEKPLSFIKPANTDKPKLVLKVKIGALKKAQINCFIQGSDCNVSTQNIDEETTEVTIVPTSPVNNRRRFLYTITVRDKSGEWHWFSHLWINPAVNDT